MILCSAEGEDSEMGSLEEDWLTVELEAIEADVQSWNEGLSRRLFNLLPTRSTEQC